MTSLLLGSLANYDHTMVKAQNTAAIAQATGRAWDEWVRELDEAGAQQMKHAQIAALAGEWMPAGMESPGWWAQGVAVAYEQDRGLRVPGQSSDGSFTASASKTFSAGDRHAAFKAWLAKVDQRTQFNGVDVAEPPAQSSTEKWHYWRVRLEDGSRVSLGIADKGDGRAALGLEHSKLYSPEDIDRWKPYWQTLLAEL